MCVKFYTIVKKNLKLFSHKFNGLWEETFFDKTFLETSKKKKKNCHISMHGPSWSPKLYEDVFFFFFFHILLIVKLG